MIFPLLGGIFSFARAPVTWMIFLLNLLVLVFTFSSVETSQHTLENFLRDRNFTDIQGRFFSEYVRENAHRYPATVLHLAEKTLEDRDRTRRQLMGSLAFRDTVFLKDAMQNEFSGDPVEISWWRERLKKVSEVKDLHPSYDLGVTQDRNSWVEWVTYQFTHAGFPHFIGNMIFLMIFATNLEVIFGGLTVLAVYLLSGAFGAVTFLLFNEASAIPLIGASGAVSGIMAFTAVVFWRQGLRYVYFLFVPKRGFAGLVYLPAWVTLILWGLSDLAGYIASPNELSGVAYSAHLGGEFCGLMFGLLLLGLAKLQKRPLFPPTNALDFQPVLTRYS